MQRSPEFLLFEKMSARRFLEPPVVLVVMVILLLKGRFVIIGIGGLSGCYTSSVVMLPASILLSAVNVYIVAYY